MNILCFGSEPWKGLWQRHHHMMLRLYERGHKIIYCEQTNLIPAVISFPRLPKQFERLSDGMVVIRPLFLPYHYRLDLIEAIDARRTMKLIEKALFTIGADRPDVIIVHSPYYNFLIDRYPGSLLIYDCVDACDGVFDNGSSTDEVKRWMHTREETLLRRADGVMAVSKGLFERCNSINNNTYHVSNGASRPPSGGKIPETLDRITRPILGYVGSLGDWLDYSLLVDIARSRPSYSLVFLGPLNTKDDSIDKLRELKNVHFLGKVDFGLVSSYIHGFDVCLIPFKLTTLTRMADPVKMYEYAAHGKPIVSTPLDGVLDYPDLAYTSDGTSEGFAMKVDEALREGDPSLIDHRKAVAREHDWDTITSNVEEILLALQNKGKRPNISPPSNEVEYAPSSSHLNTRS